jgi:hypothetical protein
VDIGCNRIRVKGANLLHFVVELINILVLEKFNLAILDSLTNIPQVKLVPIMLPPIAMVNPVVYRGEVNRIHGCFEFYQLAVNGDGVDGFLLPSQFPDGPKDISPLPFLKVFLPKLKNNIARTYAFADQDAEHPILVFSVQCRALEYRF